MNLVRRYEKWFNRDIPLLTAQYWCRGEFNELYEITEGAMRFSPLFVFKNELGTDIYYRSDTDNDTILINYFQTHPKRFRVLAKEYEKECAYLLKSWRDSEKKNFVEIFNRHVSLWGKFDSIYVLANAYAQDKDNLIFKKAFELRKKMEKVEYISGDNLINLAKDLVSSKFKDVVNLLKFEEIASGRMPSDFELQKRKEGFIYFEDAIYSDLSIKGLERLHDLEIQDSKMTQKEHLRGFSAMHGKVEGKVRIIFKIDQISRVKKGDILIAPMTTPDYAPAMKKAAAFVTDEVGITCHASIVARELKKPCIIGTKLATTLFKDGDLVNVNADEGVVRLLKRA